MHHFLKVFGFPGIKINISLVSDHKMSAVSVFIFDKQIFLPPLLVENKRSQPYLSHNNK